MKSTKPISRGQLANVFKEYDTITALLADQATQSSNRLYKVIDASDDTNISFPSGETKLHAYYEYKGTPNGVLADYDLVSAPYGSLISDTTYTAGTWNANLYGHDGGSISAGQQKFIRVGNQVTLWYDITLSSNPDYSSVLTGAVRLGGLPYTSSVNTSSAISHSHYIDYVSSTRTTLFFELEQGTSYLRMVSVGSTQPRTIIDSNNLQASSLSMIGSITYIIQS